MFMPKPPFLEALRFGASPRMLRFLLVVLFAILVPTTGANLAREFLLPQPAVLPGVPSLSWTVDGSRYSPPTLAFLPGELPSPGPNQIKKPDACEPPAKFRRGGCWLIVGDEKPPCDPPPGKPRRLWPDDDRCWLPVAEARPPPTSGGSFPATIAE